MEDGLGMGVVLNQYAFANNNAKRIIAHTDTKTGLKTHPDTNTDKG